MQILLGCVPFLVQAGDPAMLPNLTAFNDIPIGIGFLGLICEQGDTLWVNNFCIGFWKQKMFPLSLWGRYNWRKLKPSVWVAGCANLYNWKFIFRDWLIKTWSILCFIGNVVFGVVWQDTWKFQPTVTEERKRWVHSCVVAIVQAHLVWVAYINLCLISKRWCMHSGTWGCNSSVLRNQKAEKILGSWLNLAEPLIQEWHTFFILIFELRSKMLSVHPCWPSAMPVWLPAYRNRLSCFEVVALCLFPALTGFPFPSTAVFHGIITKNHSEPSWILLWRAGL